MDLSQQKKSKSKQQEKEPLSGKKPKISKTFQEQENQDFKQEETKITKDKSEQNNVEVKQSEQHHHKAIATTSGSELEIEQRVMMKGNYMAPRNSLLDFIQFNSWIKKSNYEGIFNLFLVIFGFVFFHKPLVNFMKMGRPFEPEIFQNILLQFYIVILMNTLLSIYAYIAFFIQKLILLGLPEKILVFIQFIAQIGLILLVNYAIQENPQWPITHFIFLAVQVQIIVYKMHSYAMTNLELRAAYKLEKQKQGESSQHDNKPLQPKDKVAYPDNITLKDFTHYMLMPTLVYEINFPKRNSFRIFYFLSHSIMVLGNILIQYIVFTEDLYPVLKANQHASLWELYFKLLMSIILLIMLTVFLLFESLPNAMSELTYYADREFYQDWWNATTMEEFFLKWIRFTYLFYYRHIYMEFIIKLKLNPTLAKILTSLITAFLQELGLAMFTQKWHLYLFKALQVALVWQLIQERFPPLSPDRSNAIILFGWLIAFPFVITCYLHDFIHVDPLTE